MRRILWRVALLAYLAFSIFFAIRATQELRIVNGCICPSAKP